MKVIISGSRWIEDYALVSRAIKSSGFKPTLIIEGGQRRYDAKREQIVGGVDWLARQWADAHNIEVRTEEAQWRKHGKAAGPIRNRLMAEIGDVLIAIPEGRSKGTWNMVETMKSFNKPIFIYDEFMAHLDRAAKIFDSWPDWKKNSGLRWWPNGEQITT